MGSMSKRIRKIDMVIQLARKGEAIYHVAWNKKTSAAFLANWPANKLQEAIDLGLLFQWRKHA